MAMPTAVNKLKQHLETEAGVVFEKDPHTGKHWNAKLGSEVIVPDERTLSQAVWKAARQLGEDV